VRLGDEIDDRLDLGSRRHDRLAIDNEAGQRLSQAAPRRIHQVVDGWKRHCGCRWEERQPPSGCPSKGEYRNVDDVKELEL
jgi:hypothetical protein